MNMLKLKWLPYGAAIFGILLSLIVSYIARHDIQSDINILGAIEMYIPWIILAFGVSISLLIAMTLRSAQTASEQAATLKQTNEALKKEISDRLIAEETRQKLEVALLQGQKLQSIGTLAGGIAHDFNNILYAIIGYTEISRQDVQKEALIHKNLGKVLDACHRGQELISRILAFSRRQHHDFEPLDLRKTIEAVLSLLKPTIPASVMIDFENPIDSTILGNQTQIHQVLVNLITNSVDAMDGEGTIHLKMSRILANDPLLKQFPETKAQNYCKIELTDTGHGMDQHLMERIFEPFYTTKEVGKGTGLGLSIVHSIIKEHQGEVLVKSQLGKGTTFTLLLPEYSSLGVTNGQNTTS